jgi:hypothetical protein
MCPLPGIPPWDDIVRTKRTWHFGFFDVRDLPEMLIAGRERQFLAWFHNSEAVNSRAFTNEAEETYARAYSMPGALRAGFEYYRAFPADVIANRDFAKRKLAMPVLGIDGSVPNAARPAATVRVTGDDLALVHVMRGINRDVEFDRHAREQIANEIHVAAVVLRGCAS